VATYVESHVQEHQEEGWNGVFFRAGWGWDDLSAERAAEMIHNLPPLLIEGLVIRLAPYGSPFMDEVIDWIEKKSTNLKTLVIASTCVGGRNVDDGRDAEIRFAKTLAAKNTIETLWLFPYGEYLVRSSEFISRMEYFPMRR